MATVGNLGRGFDQLLDVYEHRDFMRRISDGVRREREPLPEGLRVAVLRRDRFTCGSCLLQSTREVPVLLHVDHLVPVAAGGSDRSDNLRALCEPCNVEKSNLFTMDVRSVRPRLIVAYCHNEIPLSDEVEIFAARMVFCATCKHRATVDAQHAERYEFSGWLAREQA